MINVGIIGFGKMGKIRAEALKGSGKGYLLSVYDEFPKNESDINYVNAPEDILNDPKIDVVFLCVPNKYNKPYTIQALESGKHVFCEKPPAFSTKQVIQIKKAEIRSGKKLMYGFNHRHHESVVKMHEIINSNEYGRVLWMRGRYGKSVDESYFDTWRAKKELAGGGIVLDQGIHMVDLFLYLGGNFDEVQATVSNLYWRLDGIEDNVFAILKNNESGMVASLHSTMTQWRHLFSLEIFLEAGYMTLNGLKTSSGTYGEEVLTIAKNRTEAPAATWDDEERIHFTLDRSWLREVNHFLDAINEDTDIKIGTSDDALKVMKIVDKIYGNERHEAKVLRTSLIGKITKSLP